MTENANNGEEFTEERPEDKDIIIDLPYLPQVETALGVLGVNLEAGPPRTDQVLDLGVLTVADLKAGAAAVEKYNSEKTEPDKFPVPTTPKSDLDKILVAIRQYFRNSNEGWTPEIGKNRTMSGVHGAPHIGGSAYPKFAEAPTLAPGTGDKVRVGLIDTKLYRSGQFNGRVLTLGESFLDPDFPFTQLNGHATFTAGLILDTAEGAVVIAKAVLRDEDAQATVWDVARAMAEFVKQNVSILVLPLVCFPEDGKAPLAMQRAVDVLRNKVVVVAAAGNHGDAKPDENRVVEPGERVPDVTRLAAFPAACAGAIAVGAVGRTANGFARADFSPDVPWVQVVAPGYNVTSLFLSGEIRFRPVPGFAAPTEPEKFDGGATWSGTSFAAAKLGGLIADAVANGQGTAFEVAERLLHQKPLDGVGAYNLLPKLPALK
jgi:membrane-anchored mycosin MYCP